MKIAFFHELDQGGARRAANEFAKQLKQHNVVDLYVLDDKQNKSEFSCYNSVSFFKFIPKKWKGNNWKVRLYKDSVELLLLLSLHKKIAKKIDTLKYDAVIVNPSKYTQAPFILRFLKTKKVYYCQEPLRIAYDSLVSIPDEIDKFRLKYEQTNRSFRKSIDERNLSCADTYIVPSKYRAGLFLKVYGKKAKVVYCGVDTSFFKPSDRKRDIDILYIGSGALIDGYDTFQKTIKLMKHIPKIRAVLTNKEWLNDNQLRKLYLTSKILVCTARKEGLGLPTLEAMSCSTAVVAVNEAGHKETVINGLTGFLLPRDPKKIARKLDWLLSHPKEIKNLGRKGREIAVKEWSWNKRSKELEKVIKTLLI